MKTIKEWYKSLEEPYRTQALDAFGDNPDNIRVNDLHKAICCGFEWGKTKQGAQYWINLSYKLINN